MNILLSNDDGCQAPGLQVLAAELAGLGNIHVVAPDRDRSGASNSLTLDTPIRARQGSNGFTFVDGKSKEKILRYNTCTHPAGKITK